MIQVAALQTATLGMDPGALEHYFKTAAHKGVDVMVLGEYVLNHFFKELEKMPLAMIKDQSNHHLGVIRNLARRYEMVVVAPLVQVKGKRCYKSIVKVTPKTTHTYYQQILIDYGHWDEERFFANEVKPLEDPMIFTVKNTRIGILAGFELHFNHFFDRMVARDVDLLLLPTASTFESHNRWREIIKTRAFLHNLYILRVNRIGEYVEKEIKWKFYGDSMLVNPSGEVESALDEREAMMIVSVERKKVKEARRSWGFEKQIRRRPAT